MSVSTEVAHRITHSVRDMLNAEQVVLHEPLQALWGGQGQLLRIECDAPHCSSIIVKYISIQPQAKHPRGWNTNLSLRRKARSYEVECHWYEHYAHRCSAHSRVAASLGLRQHDDYTVLLLEDLSTDFPMLRQTLSVTDVRVCLHWLAEFHALFMHETPHGLWSQGCYWHLDTRPDEWQAMEEGTLKQAASWLDTQLRQSRFQTLVHGDAKVANFCFKEDMSGVAAVDFQYVGQGCGMSDVVYLLGSCLTGHDCEQSENELLDGYFRHLLQAVKRRYDEEPNRQPEGKASDELLNALEQEWRYLYAIAWADFQRFLLGWMPTHPKITNYSDRLCQQALAHWHDQCD